MKAARKKLWGWYFFDWATQPYSTLMLTFVFGPFFATIASEVYMGSGLAEQAADAKAQSLWSLCLTIVGLIVGFGAPFMGAVADVTGRRLPWIVGFSILYIAGSMSLWWTQPDGSNMLWMLCAFGVGFIGAEFALIFTNAQLPSLGPTKLIGKISGTGFAFGYIGGLVSLVIMLLFFLEQPSGKTLFGIDPAFGLDAAQREGTRFVGPLTAAWFLIFMIPYFRSVRDTPKDPSPDRVYQALGTLVETLKGLRHKISLSAYLGSSMFYRDALNGLYGFGGTYAVLVLNWELTYLGVFGIISIIAAALFCWVGGKIDAYTGPKPLIIITIWSLIAVCLTVVCLTREQIFGFALPEGSNLPDIIFFCCGIMIGGMGGILQSASRTMMVRHTDAENATQNFGLFGLSGRATAFMAPALIALVTTLSGSARIGVSPLILLFLIGLFLLRWVQPKGDQEGCA